jgi:hypothetical protein
MGMTDFMKLTCKECDIMAKKNENQHVLAVKDYQGFMKELEEGKARLSGNNKELCKQLLSSPIAMVSELKGLRKFIKKIKASKKDVGHYWEGLLVDGYALIAVEHENDRELRQMCDGEKMKFVE